MLLLPTSHKLVKLGTKEGGGGGGGGGDELKSHIFLVHFSA